MKQPSHLDYLSRGEGTDVDGVKDDPADMVVPNRGKFIWDNEQNKLVPYGEQKKTPRLNVITDDIPEGIQSMVTGKWYTSKHRLRQEYKELGYIEIGNDKSEPVKDVDPHYDEKMEAAVTEAYYAVRDGNAPLTEMDKARCEMANRSYQYNYDRRERNDDGSIIE